MASLSHHVPGADNPAQITAAVRLRRIRRQAKASEQVIDLLAELAYGPPLDWNWPAKQQHITAEALG